MKRAIIYARHIACKQYEKSMSEQNELCIKYANEHSWQVVGQYEDFSAEKQQHYPNFENIKMRCKKRDFDYFLICSPLALGRDYSKIKRFEQSIAKYGIKVIRVYNNSELEIMLDAINSYKSSEVQK